MCEPTPNGIATKPTANEKRERATYSELQCEQKKGKNLKTIFFGGQGRWRAKSVDKSLVVTHAGAHTHTRQQSMQLRKQIHTLKDKTRCQTVTWKRFCRVSPIDVRAISRAFAYRPWYVCFSAGEYACTASCLLCYIPRSALRHRSHLIISVCPLGQVLC